MAIRGDIQNNEMQEVTPRDAMDLTTTGKCNTRKGKI